MPVRLSHPAGLLEQNDYAPVAIGRGSNLVLIAGQAGVRPSGETPSRDLADQTHLALQNVVTAVRGSGGDVGDIARLTVFVVGWEQGMAPALLEGFSRAQTSHGLSTPLPPFTLIGVSALWSPDLLVEIEAVAVLDAE
jgi:enamine deaminase RidA (YjgF/YER057c/UK114 family)